MKEEFHVVDWSHDVIVARAESRAADIDLRISLVDRTAERTSRETAARGASQAKAEELHVWRLESPPNNDMQRTKPGQDGASPLISVFYAAWGGR
jgi:hypothetical protein